MIEIGLGHYLTLGAVIFSIGIIGIFLNRKNVIVILMSIELILLAVVFNIFLYLGSEASEILNTPASLAPSMTLIIVSAIAFSSA